MEDLETKKLRDSLVEYEGYLREMRQVTLKNVETLDVIQRYTDKSAAGMQKLAEQSLDGIQRVTAESAGGLRRIIETGTSNVSRMAEAGEANVNLAAQEGVNHISRLAETSEANINLATQEGVNRISRLAEDGETNISRAAQECLNSLNALTATGEENVKAVAQECLNSLQSYAEASMTQITASYEKNQETAEIVEKIEAAILEHMDAMKALLKQSDDFTHKENVKVYRNVQAVVVDEVKKQTESLAAQNEELVRRNELLQKQNKGLRPLMIVTLLAAVANIALVAAQILGLF